MTQSTSALQSVCRSCPAMCPVNVTMEENVVKKVEGNREAPLAYSVGYESASQFSREYRRLFGKPPLQDAAAARELARIGWAF